MKMKYFLLLIPVVIGFSCVESMSGLLNGNFFAFITAAALLKTTYATLNP